jgi:hypothetical protein
MIRLILVSFIILASSCASIPLATDDQQAAAKSFAPPPGKGNLYVARTFGAMASVCQVLVDGAPVGSLASGTFHVVPLNPGPHTVVVTGEESQASTRAEVIADACTFVSVEPSPGWRSWQWKLKQVTESEGRELVTRGNMVARLESQ